MSKKGKIMLEQSLTTEHTWKPMQDSNNQAHYPPSYRSLLSYLATGWKIIKVELSPSWDQYGLVYRLTLKRQPWGQHLQLILPKESRIDDLIYEYTLPGNNAQDCRI
jgi:hypothetical protein